MGDLFLLGLENPELSERLGPECERQRKICKSKCPRNAFASRHADLEPHPKRGGAEMKRMLAHRTAAAAVSIFVIASGGAVAQTATAPATAELIRLSQAIQAAEQAVQGRAFEVEIESEDDSLVYELELVDGNNDVHEVVVDAQTGEVIAQDEQTVEGIWQRWLNSEELAAVTGAERSLSEIINIVEAETGASVREASIDSEKDRVVYEMELEGAAGDETELEVDPATGEILKREVDD